MKVIYVAGKYTSDDPHEIDRNILKASKVAIECWKKGWAAICPHKNTSRFERFENDDNNLSWKLWMDGNLEILSRCDAIIMLKSWKNSKGAKIEHEFARSLGIMIYYEKDGIPDATE